MSDNELIAEFIGWRRQEPGEYNKVSYWKPDVRDGRKKGTFMGYCDSMKFDESWDWLMPVVEKITKLSYETEMQDNGFGKMVEVTQRPYLRTFGMIEDESGYFMARFNRCALHMAPTLIEATYSAVVEFIKLHNQQKP